MWQTGGAGRASAVGSVLQGEGEAENCRENKRKRDKKDLVWSLLVYPK